MFEECLYFNTNALARTVTRIWTEAYKQFDLSPPHAFLLRVVLARPGLLPNELAIELGLSRSTVTRFLDSLEQRDFLKRKPTGKDGREVQIYPTARAEKIHRQLDSTGQELTKRMRTLFGNEEISATVETLRKLRRDLEVT